MPISPPPPLTAHWIRHRERTRNASTISTRFASATFQTCAEFLRSISSLAARQRWAKGRALGFVSHEAGFTQPRAHFMAALGSVGVVEEKGTRGRSEGAKSVLSSSRQFTISLPLDLLSHNPVQTKPIYIARAVKPLPLPPPPLSLSFARPFPLLATAAAGHTPSFISRTLS